jgi:hypothetical protein
MDDVFGFNRMAADNRIRYQSYHTTNSCIMEYQSYMELASKRNKKNEIKI